MKIDKKVYNQNELIIVFEDFDANQNNVLKKRDTIESHNSAEKMTQYTDAGKLDINENIEKLLKAQILQNEDGITLDYVLAVLDGIVELNESIVFFTTNTLDIIDPAITRPGRVDKVLKMDYINSNMLEEIVNYYYVGQKYSKYKTKIKNIENKKMSYSRIIQIAIDCKNVHDFFNSIK